MLYSVCLKGTVMNNERFLFHLLASMSWQRKNALDQEGKTDLEPDNYRERIDRWYSQIIDLINDNPPCYYVEAIEMREDEYENVKSIIYDYYVERDNIEVKLKNTVINTTKI